MKFIKEHIIAIIFLTTLTIVLFNYNDSNENIYLHNLTYYIFNNEIIFIDNSIYKADKYNTTFNFFSGGTGNEITYLALSSQPTVNSEEGVLIL